MPQTGDAAIEDGGAAAATQPTEVSVTSLYLSNWTDAQNLWMASKLTQTDATGYGPRIGEMRIANDWTTNQIVDYSDFFRDETSAAKYDQAHKFQAEAYLDEGGILRTRYLDYAGASMPVSVNKDFAMVPNEGFTVAKLTIANPTSSAIHENVLEQLHVSNKTLGSSNAAIHGFYDANRNALFVDMSGSGQFFVALAALQPMRAHQVARDSSTDVSARDVSGWVSFDADGTLKNNDDVVAADISVAFEDDLMIPAGGTSTSAFVISVKGTLAEVQAAVDTARGQTADAWIQKTQAAYQSWSSGPGKKAFHSSDRGLDLMYARALVAIKNAINPTSGTMAASTNPFAYRYKVWARDSAVTAMALDLAGFTREAEAYWYWLQARQSDDGSFKTTFNLWDSSYLPFVEPENDAIGIFLIGAWNHYRITQSMEFRDRIWPAYKKSADFIMQSIANSPGQLGSEDFSIWEETYEYNVFSQAVYAAGEDAAQSFALALSRLDLADQYNGAAGTIRSGIQRSDTARPAGLWNANGGYYNRAVNTDGTPRTTVDGASDALIVFGVLDAMSSRAQSHVSKVIATDGHDGYGISRYPGDTFYFTSPFAPAGDETHSDSPDWPQLSAYLALDAIYRGDDSTALAYLKWIVSRSFVGYMAPGEAVSRTLLVPAVSTGVEPVTAAWFVVGALAYSGQADLRVVSPQSNAGAFATLTVSSTVGTDLSGWSAVPYFLDAAGDSASGSGDTDLVRAYIANDDATLYIRVKNASGHLPSSGFSMDVYAEDFAHGTGASSGKGMFGGSLFRPMQYVVSRSSSGTGLSEETVQNGVWSSPSEVMGAIAWDAGTGNIEAAIPLARLSSAGRVNAGDWANMVIVLSRRDPTAGTWSEDDQIAIHYRVTRATDGWLYGNVD
jgi:GH15 family glucan-1,4-alpha-glucosidase